MDKIQVAKAIKTKQRANAKRDYHTFSAKYLNITNKQGDKVKLVQNNAQNKLEDVITNLRTQGRPPRIIVLKARQEGISTDTEGRMTYNTSTKSNRNGLVVAHRSDSTAALFAKTKYFYDNMDDDIQPLKQASNATELVFNTPTNYQGNKKGLNSKVKIQTAGKAGIGRSDTFHYVHLSEYAFWEGSDDNSPDKQLSGILQSVPEALDTWVIIESTANGINSFKDEWDKAVKGTSGFTPLFLPWYIHEEYVREVEDAESFISTLSKYEQWLMDDMHLPVDRVAWWRHQLQFACGGNVNTMKQENPTTPEEAFIFSGTPVFDNEKITRRIEELRIKQSYTEGYFTFEWQDETWKDRIIDSSIKFVASATKNYIRVYNTPTHKTPYVLSGDTKGEGKDEYTGQVMDNTTGKRVATVQIQLNNSKPYTWQMYCLGKYYNQALIGIEMNFNTAPLEELQRLKYKNQYYREKSEGFNGELTLGKIGWKTDGITRPRMIDKEVYLVNERLDLIQDIPTLQQMLTFVYDKNGRPDAMSSKHDDLLIADCILNEIGDQQRSFIVKKQETIETEQDVYANQMTDWSVY